MLRKVAVLSMHTSPLAQPGSGDAGGMNVYVRELVTSLAHAGLDCDVYVRRNDPITPTYVVVEPGYRVVHIDAGPYNIAKEILPDVVDDFADGVRDHIMATGGVDVIHANYWLSGVAGHRLKHELHVPLVSTFHTLALVKTESGDPEPAERAAAERSIIGCSDIVLANCLAEQNQLQRLYEAPCDRIEIVPPGVDHAFFSPGPRAGARQAIGLNEFDGPLLVFVGRIQPLKGADIAVRALALLQRPDARLMIVGGASGADGISAQHELVQLAQQLGVADQIILVAPQAHHLLSSYYRAADVCLVPSRSESFGLVALEAAACGTPVVAASVGGLRTLVDDGHTGFLIEGRDPQAYAARVAQILDDPLLAESLSHAAALRARGYTWSMAAARLRRLYADVSGALALVTCR